ALGNVTQYAYDADNRPITVTDAANHATNYGYNETGDLTSVTDRNGRQRTFTYNSADQLTAEKWLDAGGNTIRTITYNRDLNGRLTSVSDPDSAYAYTYDGNGNVTQIDNAGTPNAPHVILTMAYDANNNRTSLSDNLGGSITYTYNSNQQLTSASLVV